jgi:hypothetical protein
MIRRSFARETSANHSSFQSCHAPSRKRFTRSYQPRHFSIVPTLM